MNKITIRKNPHNSNLTDVSWEMDKSLGGGSNNLILSPAQMQMIRGFMNFNQNQLQALHKVLLNGGDPSNKLDGFVKLLEAKAKGKKVLIDG